jgi:ubiquinone biosynthesis protein UbiJ
MQAGDILTEGEAEYIERLEELLTRAADRLQNYCNEFLTERDDPLAVEIERLLQWEDEEDEEDAA